MNKQTRIFHLFFGGHTALLVICMLLVATCNSSCFVHRHKQSQTATTDTTSTHQETEITAWALDTASVSTRQDEAESTLEVEFDSTGGLLVPGGTITAADYFPQVQGRVKKMVFKTKTAVLTRDSSAKKAAATHQQAAAGSTAGHKATASSSQSTTRFDLSLLWIVLALAIAYALYRYRHRIINWLITRGWFP